MKCGFSSLVFRVTLRNDVCDQSGSLPLTLIPTCFTNIIVQHRVNINVAAVSDVSMTFSGRHAFLHSCLGHFQSAKVVFIAPTSRETGGSRRATGEAKVWTCPMFSLSVRPCLLLWTSCAAVCWAGLVVPSDVGSLFGRAAVDRQARSGLMKV